MISVFSNVESIRNSAYHIIKAFCPEMEAAQKKDLPQELQTDSTGREYLYVLGNDSETIVSLTGQKLDKHDADLYLYDTLREMTGKELPWGVLTGVRPVKLAMRQLGSMSQDEFITYMQKERRVSAGKAALAWDIAGRESSIIKSALSGKERDLGSYSMYIGIPVCPSICSYCSFSSGPLSVWKDRMDDYVDALTCELSLFSDRIKDLTLTSVYVGGGTPTVLTESQMEKLFKCLHEHFDMKSCLEFTLEAGRPDTITEDKLKVAKDARVTRLSINPQTMQQRTLDLVGRSHSVKQVEDAFALARRLGFDNINMDLIAGLPGERAEDMRSSISGIEQLGPENLTVHTLAIKRAAAMKKLDVQANVADEMIRIAADGAARMGMQPYYMYRQKSIAGNHENTGYSVPGRECIYNVMIMEEVQSIFAFGAGATTKVLLKEKRQNPDRAEGIMTELLRQDNVSNIAEYISRCREMAEQKEKTFDIV